jgi:hypothetical protein
MKTNSSLAFMQAVATFSLLSSLGLAYVINPINDSLFFLQGVLSGPSQGL